MRARGRSNPDYAKPGDEVSFADAFPLLLISQAALDALNAKLAAPVPMLRFRPNFVVANTAPHAEDGWKRVRIGDVEFDVVKPCSRCVFTTVDFERGEFDPSGEPLKHADRRTGARERGVTFGQNLIPRGDRHACASAIASKCSHEFRRPRESGAQRLRRWSRGARFRFRGNDDAL